jgi:hypothetical protein
MSEIPTYIPPEQGNTPTANGDKIVAGGMAVAEAVKDGLKEAGKELLTEIARPVDAPPRNPFALGKEKKSTETGPEDNDRLMQIRLALQAEDTPKIPERKPSLNFLRTTKTEAPAIRKVQPPATPKRAA